METDLALNMFQMIDGVDGAGTAVRLHTDPRLVSDTVGNLHVGDHGGRLADVLEGNIPPLLRHLHDRSRIHQTVAKFVIEESSSTILLPSFLIQQRSRSAGHDHQVLHISPGQARICLQGQGTDSSSNGRTSGCSCVFSGTDFVGSESCVLVNRDNALVMSRGAGGECGRQGGGTLLEVPGFESRLACTGNGQGEDGVCVAITVTVIHMSASIATGPHKYRAFATASPGYTI